MANTKARCSNCKGFFPQPEFFYSNSLQRLCTERCFNEWRGKSESLKPSAVKAKRAMKRSKPAKIPIALRMEVRARDGNKCRWCGKQGVEVHHIHYRSEGGANEGSNLILLCDGCHRRAHSSKRVWKPILLATLWFHYVDGVALTVPEVARRLERMGLLEVATAAG